MNEIKLKNRYGLVIKRALVGNITGQDIKAIVEYQLKGYIGEGEEPLNEWEIGLIANHMMTFN
jgi:hypothetical protein